MKTGSTTKYLHKDQIGSVIALSDQTGTVTDTFSYDPWGNVISRTGTTQTDYGFVGGHGVRTMPNGQMVMGRRVYDPSVGRFTTRDPIGFRGGDLNLYKYAGNSPLGAIDPNGLKKDYWWNYDPATGERLPEKPDPNKTEYGDMSLSEAINSSVEEIKATVAEGNKRWEEAPPLCRLYWRSVAAIASIPLSGESAGVIGSLKIAEKAAEYIKASKLVKTIKGLDWGWTSVEIAEAHHKYEEESPGASDAANGDD